jgi:hypothetical protein
MCSICDEILMNVYVSISVYHIFGFICMPQCPSILMFNIWLLPTPFLIILHTIVAAPLPQFRAAAKVILAIKKMNLLMEGPNSRRGSMSESQKETDRDSQKEKENEALFLKAGEVCASMSVCLQTFRDG